ncbi:4797_t:CDS:2 [Ambispora leptoticha]|uniref:4797_t:CDS:1 n=1 Tax=Ambispora leptoticha TaxID=144679 RepID=A0A9N9A7Y6_9GLOM|nr:4797_t:CDS:2 [Ambispora leptoticha]
MAHNFTNADAVTDNIKTNYHSNNDIVRNFAETQLKKYGWSVGKGLGKNEKGQTRAVQVKIKNDTKGLGQGSEDWGFAWWDQIYNDALNNLKIVRVNEDNDKHKGKNYFDGHVKLTKINKNNAGPPRTRTGIINTSESLYSINDNYNDTISNRKNKDDELGNKEKSWNGIGFDSEDASKLEIINSNNIKSTSKVLLAKKALYRNFVRAKYHDYQNESTNKKRNIIEEQDEKTIIIDKW